jgi:hypothetical protein
MRDHPLATVFSRVRDRRRRDIVDGACRSRRLRPAYSGKRIRSEREGAGSPWRDCVSGPQPGGVLTTQRLCVRTAIPRPDRSEPRRDQPSRQGCIPRSEPPDPPAEKPSRAQCRGAPVRRQAASAQNPSARPALARQKSSFWPVKNNRSMFCMVLNRRMSPRMPTPPAMAVMPPPMS